MLGQDLVAGLVTLLAAAWLTRRWWRRRRSNAPPCGDCPGCSSAPTPVVRPASDLVEITPLR